MIQPFYFYLFVQVLSKFVNPTTPLIRPFEQVPEVVGLAGFYCNLLYFNYHDIIGHYAMFFTLQNAENFMIRCSGSLNLLQCDDGDIWEAFN